MHLHSGPMKFLDRMAFTKTQSEYTDLSKTTPWPKECVEFTITPTGVEYMRQSVQVLIKAALEISPLHKS